MISSCPAHNGVHELSLGTKSKNLLAMSGKKALNLHHPTLKVKADRHVYGQNFKTTQKDIKDELLRRHLAATKYSGKNGK
ncbi:MAG: hypothetical protein H8E55_59970 [Pelagibacterales bacterium]|nr:hypothetical protein [Pelagibacterales bacterium]